MKLILITIIYHFNFVFLLKQFLKKNQNLKLLLEENHLLRYNEQVIDYLKLNNNDIEIISDLFLEYVDKYKWKEKRSGTQDDDSVLQDYNGTCEFKLVSTTYFKVDGFPNNCQGILLSIFDKNPFLLDDKKFREDITKFAVRIKQIGYTTKCTFGNYTIQISIFKENE